MKISRLKIITLVILFSILGCTEDEPVEEIAVEKKEQIIIKELTKEEFPH